MSGIIDMLPVDRITEWAIGPRPVGPYLNELRSAGRTCDMCGAHLSFRNGGNLCAPCRGGSWSEGPEIPTPEVLFFTGTFPPGFWAEYANSPDLDDDLPVTKYLGLFEWEESGGSTSATWASAYDSEVLIWDNAVDPGELALIPRQFHGWALRQMNGREMERDFAALLGEAA